MRELRVAQVRVPPDLVCLLGADQLQRDGPHRRDRRDFDQSLGFGVPALARDACDGIQPSHEQTCRPVRSGVLGHPRMFAAAPDGPAQGTLSRAQTFSSSRSIAGSSRDAPKLITPAANTFALAGVS